MPNPTVVLVSCVKSKRKSSTAACDLYTSPLFKGMRRYAEGTGGTWYILSAEHGVLRPEEVVAPYERTLNKMRKRDRESWAASVQRQLLELLPPGAEVIILAGKRYREGIVPFLEQLGFNIRVPMAGLKFGPQLRWLKERGGGVVMARRKARVLPVLSGHGVVCRGTEIELLPAVRPAEVTGLDPRVFRATIDDPAGLGQSIRWALNGELYSLSELTRVLRDQHGATPNVRLYFSNWQRVGATESLHHEAERYLR